MEAGLEFTSLVHRYLLAFVPNFFYMFLLDTYITRCM
jgi:hypothetical protein